MPAKVVLQHAWQLHRHVGVVAVVSVPADILMAFVAGLWCACRCLFAGSLGQKVSTRRAQSHTTHTHTFTHNTQHSTHAEWTGAHSTHARTHIYTPEDTESSTATRAEATYCAMHCFVIDVAVGCGAVTV
jgi:hypothetical protein